MALRGSRRAISSFSMATWEHAEQANGLLNLAIGQPALSLLPSAALDRANGRLTRNFDARYLLQYGSLAGFSHYLRAVADFICTETGLPVDPACLFATPGNSGGLALVTRMLTKPGDTVLMEDPSYFLAHQIFRDYGVKLHPMAQHADGAGTVDVARVEKHLLDLTATGAPMPKLLYLVPTGNNPTGNTMPDGDRAKLVSLCAAHGIVIVADDVYELLQFSREGAPKPMRWHAANLNASATVISLGSWSKLLGPGLRLGWLEADEALVQALARDGEVDSGSLTSPLVETIVTEMITSGDAKIHVDALRKKLSHRATLLADAINAEQPAGSGELVRPAPAGYFLWVDLKGVDAHTLRERCMASHGVSFLPGARCALDSGVGMSFARVSFAFLEEEDLVEAGRRLGRAIAEERATASGTKRKMSGGQSSAGQIITGEY